MKYFTLSNELKVPALGIGTFMISPKDTEISVYEAIKNGYRLIDTANAYGNEVNVGKAINKAIQEGIIKREDLFLSTKLWPSVYENKDAIKNTLERLNVDYIDLLFIHQPSGNFIQGYHQLEKAYEVGTIKSIGISNFHGEKLHRLLKESKIKPHVIQLEAHPYCLEREIMAELNPYHTILMGWYPLGHADKGLLEEPVFQRLAVKYHKKPAQIILRYEVEKGIIAIPGTRNVDHIIDNIDIFDFDFTDDDIHEIEVLDGKKKYYAATDEIEERYATMNLPFIA